MNNRRPRGVVLLTALLLTAIAGCGGNAQTTKSTDDGSTKDAASVDAPIVVVNRSIGQPTELVLPDGQTFALPGNASVSHVSPDGEHLLVDVHHNRDGIEEGTYIVPVRRPDQRVALPLESDGRDSDKVAGFLDDSTVLVVRGDGEGYDAGSVLQFDIANPTSEPKTVTIEVGDLPGDGWIEEDETCGAFAPSLIVGQRIYGSIASCLADDGGSYYQAVWVDSDTGAAHRTMFERAYYSGTGQTGIVNAADEYVIGEVNFFAMNEKYSRRYEDSIMVLDARATAELDRGSAAVLLKYPDLTAEHIDDMALWVSDHAVYAIDLSTQKGYVAKVPALDDSAADETNALRVVDPGWRPVSLADAPWPNRLPTDVAVFLQDAAEEHLHDLWLGVPGSGDRELAKNVSSVFILPVLTDFTGWPKP